MAGDQVQLWTFDFLVEKISHLVPRCLLPGVEFHLLDFPAVFVQPPLTSNQADDQIEFPSELCSKDGCIVFNKGKSCLFEMSLDGLVKGLSEFDVRIALVDLQGGVSSLVGKASLNLANLATALEQQFTISGAPEQCVFSERHKVTLCDASSRHAATVYVRLRLSAVHRNVATHIRRENSVRGNLHWGAAAETETASQKENCDCNSSLKLEVNERGTTALKVNTLTHTISDECKPVVDPVHLNEKLPNPYNDPLDGRQSQTDDSKAEPKSGSVAFYLPNTVCPPPLFYHSVSESQTKSYRTYPIAHDQLKHYDWSVGSGNATASHHWSVLMAHDHCCHPVAVKDCKPESKEVEISRPVDSSAALPLLSALLDELSILKSHVESNSTDVSHTEPEKATKCLQTDNQLTGYIQKKQGKAHKFASRDRTQWPRATHKTGRFVRECCLRRNVNPPIIPRNKSVIYASDITHKRRKTNVPSRGQCVENAMRASSKKPKGRKNTHLKHKSVASSGVQIKEHSTCGHSTAASLPEFLPTKELEEQEPMEPTKVMNSWEEHTATASPAIRKLEVFVPQVTYVSKSPVASSFSGSRESLGRKREMVEAETQTELVEYSHSTTSEQQQQTISFPESISSQFSNSELLSSHASTSQDDASPKSKPEEDTASAPLSQASPMDHVEETLNVPPHSNLHRSASQEIDIVITPAPKHGSLSQEYSRRASVDSGAAFFLASKPSSLLNIASQTYDSFMSIDSLDVGDSAILPKHQRESCVVYLATSQSTVTLSGDEHDQKEVRVSDQEEQTYSLEYSDDFEELDSGSTTGSNS